MEQLQNSLERIDHFIWGPVMLLFLVGTGVFLTIRMKFLPWRNLPYALKSVLSMEAQKKGKGLGDISPFSALMTSLAATIGTGNIAGVATALVMGGPGSLVWMWLSACFGLSTKFAECMLAVKYRIVNEQGEMSGGPMYTMQNGWKHKRAGKVMGIFFAVSAVLASLGIGNLTQANSISSALKGTFHISTEATGIVLTALVFLVIIGGIRSIAGVSNTVVPVMAVLYIVAGLVVMIGNIQKVPEGLRQIISMAFSTESAAGGACGMMTTTMAGSIRWGVARGVFSNEAGMGSAAIAAAAAKTDSPVKQGYLNMTGTFFDTMVVCSMTGLIIASSGVLGARDGAGELISGVALTMEAFATVLGGFGRVFVSVMITVFAFSTMIGWEYLGEKALEYLWDNTRYCLIYRIFFSFSAYFGATAAVRAVWSFSDIANGLMAIPNLICILVLSNQVVYDMKEYQNKMNAQNKR